MDDKMDEYLLNSSSPLSELPTTWNEWEKLYQSGKIDLNDPPPPPPGDRDEYDFRPIERFSRVSGHYIAPFPEGDFERSRKVEGLNLWRDQWRRGQCPIEPATLGGHISEVGRSWWSEVVRDPAAPTPSPRSSLSSAFSDSAYSSTLSDSTSSSASKHSAGCSAHSTLASPKNAVDHHFASFRLLRLALGKLVANFTFSLSHRPSASSRTTSTKSVNGAVESPLRHPSPTTSAALPPTPVLTPPPAPPLVQRLPLPERTTSARDEQTDLQHITDLTRNRFGSDLSAISIMGRTESIFIAPSMEGRPEILERSATACDHVILKAMSPGSAKSKSSAMVVLDFEKDWRFVGSPEIPFKQTSFWAAAPIFLPPAFGDLDLGPTKTYPIGSLCILDFKPRQNFSNEDREKLSALAELAGMEIRRMEEEKRERNLARLKRQRDGWRIETAKRREIIGKGLETVIELEEEDGVELNAFDEAAAGRSRTDFETTFISPIVTSSNRSVLPVVDRHAKYQYSTAILDILDLSTRLISETLELNFVYFVSLPTTGVGDEQGSIRLLSSFNDRAYQFDLAQHQNLAKSKLDNLLFIPSPPTSSSSSLTSSSFTSTTSTASRQRIRRHFTTGIVTKVISEEGVCFLLGAMSDDEKRVLQRDDLAWLQGFAQDVRRYV